MTIFHAHLILEKQSIPYTVRYSPRSKHYRISVSQSGVELVLPAHIPLLEASDLMFKHRAWISAQVSRIENINAKNDCEPPEPGIVLYRGVPFQIQIARIGNHKPVLRIDENSRTMYLRIPIQSKLKPIIHLESQLKQLSRTLLRNAVRIRSDQLGVRPALITIRDQHTRWGSCSSKGSLSLNWRLIMAPPEVLDYVVVHELCHLTEHNHSRRFWQLVALNFPDFTTQRDWLKKNGYRLRPIIE